MHTKTKQQIDLFETKIAEYNAAPFLNEAQRDVKKEMESKLHELKMSLPEPVLTLQNTAWASRAGNNVGGFKSIGEQLKAVVAAETPGGRVDPRLFNSASGLGETVPSDGGFLVQQDFTNDILQTAYEVGKLPKQCRRVQISGNSNSIKIPGLDETSRAAGSRHGGVRSYWVEEAGEITGSKPKFRIIELSLKKLTSLVYATDELLADASALESFIRKVAGDEIAFNLDDVILNGTGAGQPLGVLNADSLLSQDKETGQAAATVVYENVQNMWSRMLGSSRQNAVWLINQDVEPQLYSMSLSVGTGGAPVFMPGGGASDSPYMTLFGRPVIPCEQCATLGTVGDIILGDFTNGYVLAEKGGIKADMSIHVRFIYDESVFRFVVRVDGQPMLSSAVTPYKGSNTQSHFVALAERA